MSRGKKLISLLVDLDSALDWTVYCSFSRVLRKHQTSEMSPIIIDQCSWNYILWNFSMSFASLLCEILYDASTTNQRTIIFVRIICV